VRGDSGGTVPEQILLVLEAHPSRAQAPPDRVLHIVRTYLW
jgi:hypothetical protein